MRRRGAAIPVPVRFAPAERLPLAELEPEANVRFALAEPLDCGWNVTLTGMLCPGARVRGRLIPLTVYSELVRLPEVTVTLLPEAVRERFLVAVEPTITLPKFSEPGDNESCAELVPVAAPNSAIESWLPLLPTTAINPDAFPEVVGR